MKIRFGQLDRRIIYLFVFLALSGPLVFDWAVPPARMQSSDSFFNLVDALDVPAGDVAWLALDFGPSTQAENAPQAEVIIEHLLRRRIPFVVSSLFAESAGFIELLPRRVVGRLVKETGEAWEYGRDWVNLGYRPGRTLFVQSLAKASSLTSMLGRDAYGARLTDLPATRGLRTLKNVRLLVEVTGSVGVFSTYVQFFQLDGYRPTFGHGCTSITVPEAYIYLDSKQLDGLLEGLAGAAWYSERLKRAHPKREVDSALRLNTGLGVAQLLIVLLVLAGNVSSWFARRKRREV